MDWRTTGGRKRNSWVKMQRESRVTFAVANLFGRFDQDVRSSSYVQFVWEKVAKSDGVHRTTVVR